MNNFVSAIPLVSLSTGSLDTTYLPMNVAGIPHACFTLNITNNSGNIIIISYDGVNDHEVILANAAKTVLKGTGDHAQYGWCFFPKGQVFYVKSATKTAGAIYISGYYL